MKVAKAKGRLRGKQRSSSPTRPSTLLQLHDSGTTPRPNSPNSSASGDRRSTALLKGCGPNPSNLSGPSPTLWRRHRTPNSALRGNLSRRTNAKVSRYGRMPNPSEKPELQSGLLRHVPASRMAAIHACQISRPRAKRAQVARFRERLEATIAWTPARKPTR